MKVTIDTKEVVVKELTVAEIRSWLAEMSAMSEMDAISASLIEGVDFGLLGVMTDIAKPEIENMTPSQLQQVADACKERNRHFFTLWARIIDRANGVTQSKPSTN